LLLGFFLITTDIMGPYSTGFTMGTLGWGPGERQTHDEV
jgi:hypothetical protein